MLIDTINEEGELDPGDMPMVREAYAALAIQAMGKASADKKIDFKDYITQVNTLAHDNNFIKTIGNIEKSDIMSFIKDEKAPAKLMDQVLFAKKFAKENDNNIVHPQAPAVNKELGADIKPVL
ncbi:MAG: hypothetical protein IKR76_12305 [Ruminococcus sp.]|nr:hypothetical protein [Ruminococcus sp.]